MSQMIGVGSVVTTPLIGNLSDRYGRKVLITLPLTVSLIPQGNLFMINYRDY
jgi:MFS family permease